MSKGLHLGLEGLLVKPAVASKPAVGTVVTLELPEALMYYNTASESLSVHLGKGFDLCNALENLCSIKANIENYSLQPAVLDLVNGNGDLTKLTGIRFDKLNATNAKALAAASTEAIGETAKKAWDAVIEFLKKLIDKVREFLAWLFQSGKALSRSLKAIQEGKDASSIGGKEVSAIKYGYFVEACNAVQAIREAVLKGDSPQTIDTAIEAAEAFLSSEKGEAATGTAGSMGWNGDTLVKGTKFVTDLLDATDGLKAATPKFVEQINKVASYAKAAATGDDEGKAKYQEERPVIMAKSKALKVYGSLSFKLGRQALSLWRKADAKK